VIETLDVEETDLLVTVNVVLLAPAATLTLAGTVAALVLLLESVTVAPPDGAAPESATVPWAVLPPTTLVGEIETDVTVGFDVEFVSTSVTVTVRSGSPGEEIRKGCV
jgi:hypothetical protein